MSSGSEGSPRYELKFVVRESTLPEVSHWLDARPEGFVERYPGRWVNSLYFDTPSLEAYAQNLGGGRHRLKLRYRWYGELEPIRRGRLEVKVRRNRLGYKLVYPVATDPPSEGEHVSLVRWLRREASGESARLLSQYALPISITRYSRRYYATAGDAVRVTLDTSLQLFDQRHGRRLNLRRRLPDSAVAVVEVKFSAEHEADVRPVLESLPLRASRFSKYVSGVSRAGII